MLFSRFTKSPIREVGNFASSPLIYITMKKIAPLLLSMCLFSAAFSQQKIWLSSIDLSKMYCAKGLPKTGQSILGDSMKIGGQLFTQGVGTLATSHVLIKLDGKAKRFTAKVGLDDKAYVHASLAFYVVGDKKLLWKSGPVKRGEPARTIDVDLTGVRQLGLLVTVVREDISENYADWGDAQLTYNGAKPVTISNKFNVTNTEILTPAAPSSPRINGASITGARPGAPFLHRIPVTGQKPVRFDVSNLPAGLSLDPNTGIISGAVQNPGRYNISISATNGNGSAKKSFTILIDSNALAVTPSMGWNSWYIHYHRVSDSLMRLSADAMLKSGMADYGYNYVNIDDCWAVPHDRKHPEDSERNSEGMILPNKKFPDMKGMTDYFHSKGLKAGIYSSPGPTTCAGYTGSYQHEWKDVQQFADWGFDFLKYDWCSYGSVIKDNNLQKMQAPYRLIAKPLKASKRDIVLNLCQYGMGDVWKWGAETGQSWRTTGDLGVANGGVAPGFYNVGMMNAQHAAYAKPNGWNDPDYILIGWVGSAFDGGEGTKTTLSNDEQYAYMSMWSLMAAPLIFSGDMAKLDPFTLNVLCNQEVIAVDQDSLGKQGVVIRNDSTGMIMVKEMSDGSKAVGLFNFTGDKQNPVDYFAWDPNAGRARKMTLNAKELEIIGKFKVRDLWRQKDLGTFNGSFVTTVPHHGVMMLSVKAEN
jgi:alpha-galactosidase